MFCLVLNPLHKRVLVCNLMYDIGPIHNYIILHYDTNVADVHFAMCYYHWFFATAHLVTKIFMSVKALSRE